MVTLGNFPTAGIIMFGHRMVNIDLPVYWRRESWFWPCTEVCNFSLLQHLKDWHLAKMQQTRSLFSKRAANWIRWPVSGKQCGSDYQNAYSRSSKGSLQSCCWFGRSSTCRWWDTFETLRAVGVWKGCWGKKSEKYFWEKEEPGENEEK